MNWLIGIIGLVLFLIIWGYADFRLGRAYHTKQTRKRVYPRRKGDIELITSGPELFQTYFDDIREARSSIQIIFYIVQNDYFSQTFFHALGDQAEKGVKIHLLLDWVGSRKVPKDWVKEARRKGIHVTFCHRARLPFLYFTLQQRNHRKVTIIDGEIGYLGGYNIGMEYIDLDPHLTPWRDYHIRLKGGAVQDLQTEFWIDWKKATNQQVEVPQGKTRDTGNMIHMIRPSEGVELEETIIDLIDAAERTIVIGTPYFIPPEKTIVALERALKRGIKVKILVPNIADHLLVKEASFPYLRRILALGGSVYQLRIGFFHAKVMVIDGKICDIGTANFDYRSMRINYEMNCLIYDKGFIAKVEEALDVDIEQSDLLRLDKLNEVGLSVRIQEWIGWLVKGLL